MSHKRFPVRIPRFAPGIRMQETRTGASRSWWARAWRTILEDMGLKARLGRGRNYAMGGQVIKMELEGSRVRALVQGTREEPYRVEIAFTEPEGEVRALVLRDLKAEPILLARLLAGDLPYEVDDIFRRHGASLFPGGRLADGADGKRRYDVTTSCRCPDYANPCKHSSAVLLLLGEEIARRPLTLLELRGFTLEDLIHEN